MHGLRKPSTAPVGQLLMPYRKTGRCPLLLGSLIPLLFAPASAFATMPPLTEKPSKPSLAVCQKWAKKQDEDAVYMWGLQESGKSSPVFAQLRLTLYCLGDTPPEIVGFGSSAGFNQSYCERHSDATACHSGQ